MENTKPKRRPMSLRLPQSEYDLLSKYAQAKDITMTQVIRNYIQTLPIV